MNNKVTIELYVDDKGTVHVKKFAGETEKSFKKMEQQAKTSTTSMGSSLQKLKSHWMAVTAATAGTIIAIGKILKKFATWEVSLTDMKKVTSESLGSIKAKIMELPPALGTSIELVKGYYQVISAGVKHPVKSMSLLVTASKAAKAAHVAQSEVIKGLTKIMAGYEGEIKNVSEAADLLFAIEKEGQTTVAELIPLIGGLAKISHDLGISQDEMGASLALVTQTAGSTAEAATQYQGVLMALLKPTDAMKEMIKAMGFESAEAAIKQLGLAETLRRLKGATGGSAEKMAEMFGRVEGLKGMSALAANEFENLAGKVDVMGRKTGLASKAWEDYKKTSTSAWDSLKASVEKVTIAVGSGLAPATKQWAHWLTVAAEYWGKLLSGGPETGIAALEKQKEAVEAEIAQIEAIKLSMEGLKSFGTVIADSEGEKRLQALQAYLKTINASIATYNREQSKMPQPPAPPAAPGPGKPPEPTKEWYEDKEKWAEYMAEKKASFELMKQEQQSAHDFALLLAQDEVDKRVEQIEFMSELEAQAHQEELARYEEVMAANEEYMKQYEANEKAKAALAYQTTLSMVSWYAAAFKELAKGSDLAFRAQKILSATQSLMKTHEFAVKAAAWAATWGGLPAAMAAKAIAWAAGTAHVKAIMAMEPAALYHEGGIVGRGSRPSRLVSSDVFAGAQRAHQGLAPDERPVIVRKDEGIFTPAQMVSLGMGETGEIELHLHNHLYMDGREQTKTMIHKIKCDGILLNRLRRALS